MAEYLMYFNQQWVGDHTEEWFRGRGPLARRETGVTWTTSIAVSGASSGSVPGKNSVATT